MSRTPCSVAIRKVAAKERVGGDSALCGFRVAAAGFANVPA